LYKKEASAQSRQKKRDAFFHEPSLPIVYKRLGNDLRFDYPTDIISPKAFRLGAGYRFGSYSQNHDETGKSMPQILPSAPMARPLFAGGCGFFFPREQDTKNMPCPSIGSCKRFGLSGLSLNEKVVV
jgi:hypothetical protein